jgi:hypothetical protein
MPRIAVVETAIIDNPSAANFEELGELPATQPIGSPMVSFLSDDVCAKL